MRAGLAVWTKFNTRRTERRKDRSETRSEKSSVWTSVWERWTEKAGSVQECVKFSLRITLHYIALRGSRDYPWWWALHYRGCPLYLHRREYESSSGSRMLSTVPGSLIDILEDFTSDDNYVAWRCERNILSHVITRYLAESNTVDVGSMIHRADSSRGDDTTRAKNKQQLLISVVNNSARSV